MNFLTLPQLMWTDLRDNIDPAIAAVSVVLICIVVLAIVGKALIAAVLNHRQSKL